MKVDFVTFTTRPLVEVASAPPSPPPLARLLVNVEPLIGTAVPEPGTSTMIAPPAGNPGITAAVLLVKVELVTVKSPAEHVPVGLTRE